MYTLARKKHQLIAEHHLDIGKFKFYPNFVVSEFAEGVHVTKENAMRPIEISKQLYSNKIPIVYISHRLHSYSMDPIAYAEVVSMFPNFRGFAIVSQNKYRRMLANLEKLFIKKPIEVFYTLEDAFIWGEELLKKESRKPKR